MELSQCGRKVLVPAANFSISRISLLRCNIAGLNKGS